MRSYLLTNVYNFYHVGIYTHQFNGIYFIGELGSWMCHNYTDSQSTLRLYWIPQNWTVSLCHTHEYMSVFVHIDPSSNLEVPLPKISTNLEGHNGM